ncbi:MAG: hypothetical protein LBI08_01140 [Methanomassiliicoccaceae archaeon]|nr:hypothetical protein [Methanomassiliicoccaceae archaeon]
MSEVNLTVNAGACQFKTKIRAAVSDDYMTVSLNIVSDCPNVTKLAELIKTVDSMKSTSEPMLFDNCILQACNGVIPHNACPVPCGIIKACEASTGAALKKPVTFTYE